MTSGLPQRFGAKGWRTVLILLAKLCLSAGLLYWIWASLPDGMDWSELQLVHPVLLLVCVPAALLQIALLAYRWLVTARSLADTGPALPDLRFPRFFHLTWLSQAVSQVLPALVAGDGLRIAGLHYDGMPLGAATRAVVVDRVFGLAGLVLLIVPGAAASGMIVLPSFWIAGIAVLVLAAGAAAIAVLQDRLASLLVRFGGGLMRLAGIRGLVLLAMAAAGHAFSVLIFQLLAVAYGIEIPLPTTLIVFPAALLMSILPISFGGWGVREASVVYGLSLYGVAEHDALLASLIFGSFQICTAVPSIAGVFFWARRRHP